jgi:hypothetical protein
MRNELLSLLSQFNRGEMPVQLFQDGLEDLNKRGIWKHLNPVESKIFNSFFSWYVEMYDPTRPPRPGPVGKLKDTLAQFKGDYRVSLEQLKAKAQETETALTVAARKK